MNVEADLQLAATTKRATIASDEPAAQAMPFIKMKKKMKSTSLLLSALALLAVTPCSALDSAATSSTSGASATTDTPALYSPDQLYVEAQGRDVINKESLYWVCRQHEQTIRPRPEVSRQEAYYFAAWARHVLQQVISTRNDQFSNQDIELWVSTLKKSDVIRRASRRGSSAQLKLSSFSGSHVPVVPMGMDDAFPPKSNQTTLDAFIFEDTLRALDMKSCSLKLKGRPNFITMVSLAFTFGTRGASRSGGRGPQMEKLAVRLAKESTRWVNLQFEQKILAYLRQKMIQSPSNETASRV